MSRNLEMEIANFVVRFGSNYVLSDLLDEVVLPAFFSGKIREFKETTYFFHEPEFKYLEKGNVDSLALVCRLVKDTVLRRHQIYSPDDGIIPDEHEIKSAPSAIATLLLKSHRLLYVREVPNAPTAKQFGSTFKFFLRNATMDYQNSVYDQKKDAGEKVTRKSTKELFPIPDVDVVPLVAGESLKEFLGRFATLKSLKVELAATNNEIDNEEFFKTLRGTQDDVGSQRTVITHHSNEGLDTDGCYKYVEAAKQGNLYVEMKGEDDRGDDLVGTNESFAVKAQLPEGTQTKATRVKQSFNKYKELLDGEVVEVGEPEHDVSDKRIESHKRFKKAK